MKKITVITGRYGSGKTNFAANIAVKLAETGNRVTVADLDIVDPYFRIADFGELFSSKNIRIAAPMYANTGLDIPAVTFDIEKLAYDDGYLIIDVGGDDAGASVLGRFAPGLSEYVPDNFDMWYVVNRYRTFSGDINEEAAVLNSIEKASKLKCTGIVGNSNLGSETSADIILKSLDYAGKTAEAAGLPLICSTYPEDLELDIENGCPVKIYVKPPWERI